MKCQNPDCNRPIPVNRRKYCSRSCGRLTYRTGVTLLNRRDTLPGRRRPGPDEAPRRCLRCGRKFRSAWRGNRICPRCDRINSAFSVHCLGAPNAAIGSLSAT